MTNQRWILIGLGLTFVGLAMAGCKPANPLIGKWTMTQTMFGISITMTREFKADGTETMATGNPGGMDTEMTYTTDEGKLTEAVTSMTMNGKTIKIDPSRLPANAPKSVAEAYTVNGDALTITNSLRGTPVSVTYTRVTAQ